MRIPRKYAVIAGSLLLLGCGVITPTSEPQMAAEAIPAKPARVLQAPVAGIPAAPVDMTLPPIYTIPPDEVLQPGSLAEARTEVKREIGYGPKITKSPEAWTKNAKAKGKGVKVAVLDTGADVNHAWLKPNIKGTYNAITKTRDVSDGHGHGTHVCGTVVEAAPEVDLYVIKVLSDRGSGSVVDIAHGIDYAVATFQCDILNLSLGGNSPDTYMPAAIQRAEEAGSLVICAAGNAGPGNNTDGWPARYAHCFSVGACGEDSKVASFSSRGASLYTMTPGVNIVSAVPGNRQGTMSGTSMATPLASAVAASWWASNDMDKKKRPESYRLALKMASSHPDTRSVNDGYGIPDVTKLVPGSGGPVDPPVPGKPFTVTIGLEDLTANKKAELAAAGINAFSLKVGGAGPVLPPPSPMPPPTAPVAPSNCPGGVCPTPGGYYYSEPLFQPFGGFFRRR